MSVSLSDDEYRRRVDGCWLGKSIGGSLGMPYEGVRKILDLTYYNPVPTQMLANDDLDAQVVYAFLLDRMPEPRVDRHVLSRAWWHIGMSPDEYGICKRNLKLGLAPPLSGSYDNPFARGMGAAIRTELWACLAPGDPDLAAAYAYEDACMDHDGDGIHAAVFIAALQSMAFVEDNIDVLLDSATGYLPPESELCHAIGDTRRLWSDCRNWHTVQRQLAERYLTDNFTDVVINLSYIVLGWLAGAGDFGRSICAAVNAGQDTDCTGATLGALLGILNPSSISERWSAPIGRQIVLSDSVRGVSHPETIDAFTDQVLSLRSRLAGRWPKVEEAPQEAGHLAIRAEVGFTDCTDLPDLEAAPHPPVTMRPILLPGHYTRWALEHCEGSEVWVRYHITLSRAQRVGLLFNTPQPMRLWLDGEGLLGREGGAFVPAMHRAPQGQFTNVSLAAGSHELLVVMRRPEAGSLEWCVGLCDVKAQPVDSDWLVDVFDRPGLNTIAAPRRQPITVQPQSIALRTCG